MLYKYVLRVIFWIIWTIFIDFYVLLEQIDTEVFQDDDDEFDEVEGEVESNDNNLIGRDQTVWARRPMPQYQTASHNILRQRSDRPHKSTEMLTISDTFKTIFTAEMVDIIVRHTNSKALSTYNAYNLQNPEKKKLKWNNLSVNEFHAFLGVLIMSGANNSNNDHY